MDTVRDALDRTGLDPGHLVLEVTESVLVTKMEVSVERLGELKRLGVHIAIDEFGTGYSSLSSLQALPVDILEIDKAFVDGLEAGDERADLARAVLGLGRTLNLVTVAEGVESGQQADELKNLRCSLAQGYFFARSVPDRAIATLFPRGEVLARIRSPEG